MKLKPSVLFVLVASTLPVLAGSSSPSIGQPMAVAPEASPWTCRMSIYGWVEELDGDISVKGITVPVEVDFESILENLDIAVMGAVEVGRGRWSVVADGIYADLSDSHTGALGGTAHLGLEQFLGNFLVAYEAVKTDSLKFDLYAGTRVNYMETSLDYGGRGGRSFNISADETWADPVIGARFLTELPNNFFFRVLGDVGGFDVSSQFTWQVLAGFGYRFNEHGSALLGYRALGIDYTDGGFTYDVVTSGIILGYQYTF